MRGRPPTPTALKQLRGNPGKRPIHPELEPNSPIGARCPAWLDAKARALWNEWAPVFIACGCLRESHTNAFANWMAVQAQIITHHKAGEVVPIGLHKLALSYAVQFAGTPSAQARVHVAPKKPDSKLGSFLGKAS